MGENNYTGLFLKHNFLKITVRMLRLLLSGNKQAWNKIKEVNKKAEDIEFEDEVYRSIRKENKVDLLSICVLPDVQGSGISSDLINMFHKVGKSKGRDYCVLTVRTDNNRGINFYMKHGYKMTKRTKSKLSLIKEI